MVIDERIVVAGSFNYTEPANDYNDENIFVLGIGGPVSHGVDGRRRSPTERARPRT